MEKVSVNKSAEAMPKIWGLRTAPFWLFVANTVIALFLVFSNISWWGLFGGMLEIGTAYSIGLLLSDPAIVNSLFNASFPNSIKNDLF